MRLDLLSRIRRSSTPWNDSSRKKSEGPSAAAGSCLPGPLRRGDAHDAPDMSRVLDLVQEEVRDVGSTDRRHPARAGWKVIVGDTVTLREWSVRQARRPRDRPIEIARLDDELHLG